MIRSMTGFAGAPGALGPHRWVWELRSVNGKGLDLRIRVPDWVEGLETALRGLIAPVVARGNITLTLRLTREEAHGGLVVNAAQLTAILDAMGVIETQAMEAGVSLAPSRSADIAAMRGVLEPRTEPDDSAPLAAALLAEFPTILHEFDTMRCQEGTRLAHILTEQLDQVARLTATAATQAQERQSDAKVQLSRNLARVMDNVDGIDPQRMVQELAILAVKSDVTEEIDRLGAHVTAARDLLDAQGPIGRKFDFLMQEFNREANTLCSKAQNTALTQTGLALKAVIDQMREQIQNVE